MSHEESSVKLGSGGSFKNSSIHFDSMEDGQISSDFSELPVDPKETINNSRESINDNISKLYILSKGKRLAWNAKRSFRSI